jgi:hypothetical protein
MRFALGFALFALCGCATIVKGTTQSIAVTTPGVPSAECTLTSSAIGTKVVTTPATLTLEKASDHITVVCRKECYQDGTGIIASHTETMAAGNLIAGGVIGLGVDAMTGAMNRYNVENQFAMVPIQGCSPKMHVSRANR